MMKIETSPLFEEITTFSSETKSFVPKRGGNGCRLKIIITFPRFPTDLFTTYRASKTIYRRHRTKDNRRILRLLKCQLLGRSLDCPARKPDQPFHNIKELKPIDQQVYVGQERTGGGF